MTQTGSKTKVIRTARAIFVGIGLMPATFVGLCLIFPPSTVPLLVSFLVGLVVALVSVRRGYASLLAVLLSLGAVTVILTSLAFFLSRPVSIGIVATDPVAQEIDALLKKKDFSGAVLIAKDNDILLSKGYGYADRSGRIANTNETRFRLGSITKQFTAMAALILQARGKFDVRDRVCAHLPNCPPMWQEITIHHLLTHSSGMADYLPGCLSTKEQVREAIAKEQNQPLAFRPGTRFSYSNIGYRVLAEIVEQSAGQTYGDFLQENIFGPLNMTRTALESAESPSLAIGYTNSFLPVCPADVSTLHGEGGINSTVEDLYRWDRALETEKLIPRPLLELMFTVHVPMETEASLAGGAGYGWAVGQQWGHPVQMHGGFIFGYTSAIARFPEDRMTVILLSNQQNYDESIYSLVTNKLLVQD